MKNRYSIIACALLLAGMTLSACGSSDAGADTGVTTDVGEINTDVTTDTGEITADVTIDTGDVSTDAGVDDGAAVGDEAGGNAAGNTDGNVTEASDSGGGTDKVASADDMVTPEEVVEEGMEPIYADSIKDGVYDVTVDSSSSMFRIESCQLTVADGEMRAVMTMGGTGYQYLYMGIAEEAAAAGEADYISFEEDEEGKHTFEIPVEALDAGIDCAAFSSKKEMWYDRVLCFRADSLPVCAIAEGVMETVESLGLSDGEYTVEVTLEGGSGKAGISSPAQLIVENGQAYAVIIWSSPNYDYMKVDDVQYDLANEELGLAGNSAFKLPVSAFDWKIAVKADTTAMSEPHEIDYTLYFDSSTIQ